MVCLGNEPRSFYYFWDYTKVLNFGRWHHPYGRKWRGTKKPPDESESGEWKSWLKAQHLENEDHGIQSHHFMGNRWGNFGNSVRLYFFGLQNHSRWWLQKTLTPWKESFDQPIQHIKKQRHYFANKGPSSQGYGFSSSHVWMWELDCEDSWMPKNWCFWTVVLEKTLESSLDCKEIQPVHSEGDQSWVFTGRNDAKAETLVLWPLHAKSWLIGKNSDAGRVWGQEEKGTTEDEMAGWHHRLDGCEFDWTPGVGDGQGGLACCDSWRGKESDTTEWLNWTELNATWFSILHSTVLVNDGLRYSALTHYVVLFQMISVYIL